MKKIILFVLLAISVTTVIAQTNPKSGYVITNTGDTIRGIIDFRTNEKLSKQCMFWANGGSESKTYMPGDIEGFRFDDNGKYFVTRRLNVTGNPELYFAEFMVQGKMNLYCVVHNSDEYFFFEREDGEMAELTKRSSGYYSSISSFAIQEEKDKQQEKREQFGKVKSLLQKSWKAVEGMDDNSMSRKKLINVVRDYHNDVCTDGGMCMVYEYDEKSEGWWKLHFKLFAGYARYPVEKTSRQQYSEENYPDGGLEIGIGGEVELERIMKGFSAELGLVYSSKYKSEHDFPYMNKGRKTTSIEKSGMLTISIGAIKRFGVRKIQPLIRCGLFCVIDMGVKEAEQMPIAYSSVVEYGGCDHGSYINHLGAYIGAGVQMPIGKQFVRLHGDLYKSTGMGDMTKWGVTAEFGF